LPKVAYADFRQCGTVRPLYDTPANGIEVLKLQKMASHALDGFAVAHRSPISLAARASR
jgi:hypothetical protein